MTLFHLLFISLRPWSLARWFRTTLFFALPILADPSVTTNPSELAAQEYAAHRSRWVQSPTNSVEAWEFGRAAFDWSDFATNQSQKAAIAGKGIQACRQSLTNQPSAPAHYYLALNLGRLAETKGLSALHLIREMEQELISAQTLDPLFDHAGADRTLGLLYRDAPGWPVSLGDTAKATRHLEACTRLDGEFPENRLALAELYAHGHRTDLFEAQMLALDALWESARQRLKGPEWQQSWQDWDRRRRKLKALLPTHR